MAATMQDAQNASDDAQAGLEPDDNAQDNEEHGSLIQPRNNQETQDTLRELHAGIDAEVQKRKAANEEISALREKAVTLGVGKKAQAAVEAFMKLNENDQLYFDEAVTIYRAALGKPVQGNLELVHSTDED